MEDTARCPVGIGPPESRRCVVGMETRGGTSLAALPPLGSDNGHYGNQAGLDRAGLPLIPINEGLLLANLLQRSRTAFSCVSFPGFFAFFEGMYDTQTSALRSSPTVPEGFLRHRPNSPQTLARLLTGTEIRQVNSSSMR